jgi:Haem-binding domain/Cytochrome P460
MKAISKLVVAAVIILALLQLARPSIPARPTRNELQVPPEVRRILEKDCYSCHSDQRRLAWFDQVVPAYWLVRHDVLTAREHVNFSTLSSQPQATQRATLYEAVNMIQLGAMPLPRFVALHPDAKVSPEELAMLKAYLAPWAPIPTAPAASLRNAGGSGKTDAVPAAVPNAVNRPASLGMVNAELDGFPFDPSFESWKPISTTDRGDNNTFRFILGNDVALRAAASGHINPWPDGARLAKIAWQQQIGPDGLVYPGKFVQVELMVKDAKRHKQDEGWGWGRWRGLNLKPYGNDPHFKNECTGCHRPMRGNDYVYTQPITTAKVSGNEVVNNAAAALPSGLPYQPLGWSAITMYVDPKTRTIATLYGNEAAMRGVQAERSAESAVLQGRVPSAAPSYPAGAVLALVTWSEREDAHWFGGRIADVPQSVEFVTVPAGGQPGYRRYFGTGLAESSSTGSIPARTGFILSISPARLP